MSDKTQVWDALDHLFDQLRSHFDHEGNTERDPELLAAFECAEKERKFKLPVGVISIEHDGDYSSFYVWEAANGNQDIDPEAALRSAIEEYLAGEDANGWSDWSDEEKERFNHIDAFEYIPDALFAKHGLRFLCVWDQTEIESENFLETLGYVTEEEVENGEEAIR